MGPALFNIFLASKILGFHWRAFEKVQHPSFEAEQKDSSFKAEQKDPSFKAEQRDSRSNVERKAPLFKAERKDPRIELKTRNPKFQRKIESYRRIPFKSDISLSKHRKISKMPFKAPQV